MRGCFRGKLAGPGGQEMPAYRLYYMDGHSGHIVHSQVFGADDDLHAIAKAGELIGPMAMELWCDTRKVHHWDPVPATPISA